MKNRLILLSGIFFIGVNLYGQTPSPTPSPTNTEGVSISNSLTPPDPSAMLDVQSTSKGILIPRMTFIEREGISSPANGLLVYVTEPSESIGYWYWDNTSLPSGGWKRISSSDGNPLWVKDVANNISYEDGNVYIGTTTPNSPSKLSLKSLNNFNTFDFEGSQGSLRFKHFDSQVSPGPGSYLTQTSVLDGVGRPLAVGYSQINANSQKLFGITSFSDPNYTNIAATSDGPLYISSNENIIFLPYGSSGSSPAAYFGSDFQFHFSSDSILKTNIGALPSVLSKVLECEPVLYNWKRSPTEEKVYGFIAQDFETIFPTLVSTYDDVISGESLKSINYIGLTPVLLKAIQEQQVQLSEQQALIDSLNQRLLLLEAQ